MVEVGRGADDCEPGDGGRLASPWFRLVLGSQVASAGTAAPRRGARRPHRAVGKRIPPGAAAASRTSSRNLVTTSTRAPSPSTCPGGRPRRGVLRRLGAPLYR